MRGSKGGPKDVVRYVRQGRKEGGLVTTVRSQNEGMKKPGHHGKETIAKKTFIKGTT